MGCTTAGPHMFGGVPMLPIGAQYLLVEVAMSLENSPPLPVEWTKRIVRTLFPGREGEPTPMPTSFRGRLLWLGDVAVNWTMLMLALSNLLLVIFDFTYLEIRHHYLNLAPSLVTLYDPVKGVAPHRTTEAYLARAEDTFTMVRQEGKSPRTAARLAEMRALSLQLYEEAPFVGTRNSGVFEQIKNRMRRHTHLESSKHAFQRFWTFETLAPDRISLERAFFEKEIRPLLHRNYFRGIGENGRPFDAFWLLDLCFVPLFAFEFLLRGAWSVRHAVYPSWKAFCFARWYDLVYFLPVGGYLIPLGQTGWMHLVRCISVGHRMRRLGLVNPIAFPQRYVSRVVDLVTDLVSVRLLSNYQASIQRFDLMKSVSNLTPTQKDMLRQSANEHVEAIVCRVLPQMGPELQAILTYSVQQAVAESPSYQNLRRLPFIGEAVERHLPDLVSEVLAGTQRAMLSAVQDPEHTALINEAAEKFVTLAVTEMSRLETEQDLKDFVIDLLEQQKKSLLS